MVHTYLESELTKELVKRWKGEIVQVLCNGFDIRDSKHTILFKQLHKQYSGRIYVCVGNQLEEIVSISNDGINSVPAVTKYPTDALIICQSCHKASRYVSAEHNRTVLLFSNYKSANGITQLRNELNDVVANIPTNNMEALLTTIKKMQAGALGIDAIRYRFGNQTLILSKNDDTIWLSNITTFRMYVVRSWKELVRTLSATYSEVHCESQKELLETIEDDRSPEVCELGINSPNDFYAIACNAVYHSGATGKTVAIVHEYDKCNLLTLNKNGLIEQTLVPIWDAKPDALFVNNATASEINSKYLPYCKTVCNCVLIK